jgi:release factor glutamine methyltransferase
VWRAVLWLRFKLFQRHRYDHYALERVEGRPILALPQVFNPALFASSRVLARSLNPHLIPPGSTVLDMGTGSGVAAVFAAQWARRVVAVDINPEAVRCARINALLNQVDDRVEVLQGDLFAPLQGCQFDVVVFNPPFFRGSPRGSLDHAWRSTDTVERFAAGLRDHLAPNGCALVILSTDGEAPAFLESFQANGFAIEVVARQDVINEVLTIYRLKTGDQPARASFTAETLRALSFPG